MKIAKNSYGKALKLGGKETLVTEDTYHLGHIQPLKVMMVEKEDISVIVMA